MALQDVCKLQESSLCSIWDSPACLSLSSNGTTLGTSPACTWREPFEKDGGNPLQLLLPSLVRSRRSSSLTVPCPFSQCHGTTTLGFVFQGGVIAAADTRASCAGLIACPSAQKIIPIHSHLVVTTSGSGADCMLWERILAREIRLYQLRHGRRLPVNGAAKLLSLMLHPFKGTEVCVAATLCGWDVKETSGNDKIKGSSVPDLSREGVPTAVSRLTTGSSPSQTLVTSQQAEDPPPDASTGPQSTASHRSGPRVCYVCSDGLVLKGEVISVGSGSPYAYSILDDGWRWSMSVDEAVALARQAVYRATHRDAYSGNNVDLFHITERGWSRRSREDLKEEYYREEEERRRTKERPKHEH